MFWFFSYVEKIGDLEIILVDFQTNKWESSSPYCTHMTTPFFGEVGVVKLLGHAIKSILLI